LPTADMREQELRRSLWPGPAWEEQERRLAQTRVGVGRGADADADAPRPAAANPVR